VGVNRARRRISLSVSRSLAQTLGQVRAGHSRRLGIAGVEDQQLVAAQNRQKQVAVDRKAIALKAATPDLSIERRLVREMGMNDTPSTTKFCSRSEREAGSSHPPITII
jgi:hypothetical protein